MHFIPDLSIVPMYHRVLTGYVHIIAVTVIV